MAHRQIIPAGFTADSWRQAIASGRVVEISTEPRNHWMPCGLIAPVQFLRWSIRARFTSLRLAGH
jgi:hypothetical protein